MCTKSLKFKIKNDLGAMTIAKFIVGNEYLMEETKSWCGESKGGIFLDWGWGMSKFLASGELANFRLVGDYTLSPIRENPVKCGVTQGSIL